MYFIEIILKDLYNNFEGVIFELRNTKKLEAKQATADLQNYFTSQV